MRLSMRCTAPAATTETIRGGPLRSYATVKTLIDHKQQLQITLLKTKTEGFLFTLTLRVRNLGHRTFRIDEAHSDDFRLRYPGSGHTQFVSPCDQGTDERGHLKLNGLKPGQSRIGGVGCIWMVDAKRETLYFEPDVFRLWSFATLG
jgi:hypothetical protein